MGRNANTNVASAGPRPERATGPGSNGYWRRDIFFRPGTYTWKAEKAGKIKVQGLGAGAGGNMMRSGASAAFGEKTLTVAIGDTLTIVVGEGGTGNNSATVRSANGTSTSISGTPVGGTPLTFVGATGVSGDGTLAGAPGTATGPWDKSNPGAVDTAGQKGGPSSGSPFGPGIVSQGEGGAGWGGPATGFAGGGSHTPGVGQEAGSGLRSRAVRSQGAVGINDGSFVGEYDFWDLADVDGPGGTSVLYASSQYFGFAPGPGGGGPGSGTATGVTPGQAMSLLGGGPGSVGNGSTGAKGGFGAGGGSSNGGTGGKGGDAIVFIFWDEAA